MYKPITCQGSLLIHRTCVHFCPLQFSFYSLPRTMPILCCNNPRTLTTSHGRYLLGVLLGTSVRHHRQHPICQTNAAPQSFLRLDPSLGGWGLVLVARKLPTTMWDACIAENVFVSLFLHDLAHAGVLEWCVQCQRPHTSIRQ